MLSVEKQRGFTCRLRPILLIFFLLASLTLTACGGGLPDTGNPAATETAQIDTAPDATQPPLLAETVTITQAEPDPTQSETTNPEPSQVESTQAVPVESPSMEIDCSSPADPTPPMTEGPYFKAGSPERTSLIEPGVVGTRLVITGYVLTTDCQPIANALLDFWQADGQGEYDNAGYGLRGHQFTDETGRYQLETVVPGLYPGRTAHIHVKVQGPNGPILTSQLFLPDEPGNQGDRIFSPQLLMAVQDMEDGKQAAFNFILDVQ